MAAPAYRILGSRLVGSLRKWQVDIGRPKRPFPAQDTGNSLSAVAKPMPVAARRRRRRHCENAVAISQRCGMLAAAQIAAALAAFANRRRIEMVKRLAAVFLLAALLAVTFG